MRNLLLAVVLMGTFLLRTPDGWEFEFDQKKFAIDPGIQDGTGLPPVSHQAITIFQQPGQLLQNISISPRLVTITAKVNGTCLEELHALRCKLFNALRWNRTLDDPPLPSQLVYREECGEASLDCYYAGDATADVGSDEKVQATGIRLLAYDPMWRGSSHEQALAYSSSLTIAFIAGRVADVWTNMVGGANFKINALAADQAGNVYATGDFTTIGGVAANRIAKWNGSVWSALGAGLDSNGFALAIGPDGSVYVGGAFANAGGVAAAKIAKWNGAAFSALSSGMNGTVVDALAIDKNGNLYAGGDFTTAGGGAASRIAFWNGTAWAALGAGITVAGGGGGPQVRTIAIAPDGSVYVGGDFVTAGAVTANSIAKWNPTTAAWTGLSTGVISAGLAGTVSGIAVSSAGIVYATGLFTTAGGIAVGSIAQWNGVVWAAMGTPNLASGNAISIDSSGMVYAAGGFTTASSGLDHIGMWNGTVWSPIDLTIPGLGVVVVRTVLNVGTDLYFGFDKSGAANISSATTVVMTEGDFETFPTFTITGPATMQWIKNAESLNTILLALTLNAGEIATIDLVDKTITSTWRGNLLPYAILLPLSDFATWSLEPHPVAPNGNNRVSIMLTAATPVEQNDNNNQLSSWETITGITYLNTDSIGAVYATIVADGGGFFHVNLYSDSASTHLIGHTATYNTNGAKAIVADNSSGLGGTITVDARVAADADIVVYFATVKIAWTDKFLSADCAVMCSQYLPLIGVAP